MNYVYVTVPHNPHYHQISLDELLFGTGPATDRCSVAGTRTYRYADRVGPTFAAKVDPAALIGTLRRFNESVAELAEKDRHSLYRTFLIPKQKGGYRRIDAPCDELMGAQRRLKLILEREFCALYHTAAYAYVKKRCTVDAVKRHQANESKWFGKYDLHNFFGSTTKEYLLSQLRTIFPFSEIMIFPVGREELSKALDLAFLDGVLPQGTPLSPTLTNLMMIPFDFEFSRLLRKEQHSPYVYTRYADDFIISSRTTFDPRHIEQLIVDTLRSFQAPFSINSSKTRYGSANGSNWNLGVMLNKDNQITIGHKRKRQFAAILHNCGADRKRGIVWQPEDLYTLLGQYSYYRMVERDGIDAVVAKVNQSLGMDVIDRIKHDLHDQCVSPGKSIL